MLLVGDGELTVAGTLALYILIVSKTSSQTPSQRTLKSKCRFATPRGDKGHSTCVLLAIKYTREDSRMAGCKRQDVTDFVVSIGRFTS